MGSKMDNTFHGHFGDYGGRYVPEMLIPALEQLETVWEEFRADGEAAMQLEQLLNTYSGRPTPLHFAENLSRRTGQRIYLKLESLNHTGAHKINNAIGQALLARKMGKTEIVAETGAGQHGLATATVAAKFGMKCTVFMGEIDMRRQYPNVYSMKLLGAEVVPVNFGAKTLKDAVNAALKYWAENLPTSHYLLGSVVGPHPYPAIVRDFQAVIGKETRKQILESEGRLPDFLIACVGGGSNSIGLFYPFLDDDTVKMTGIEAGGQGPAAGMNAIRFGGAASVGVVQGYKSYFIQDADGQVMSTHSISAGLDYAGIGPELASLHDAGRIDFDSVTDEETLEAFKILARDEGIIPALESAHAVAHLLSVAPKMPPDSLIVVNISGRGDKDIFITAAELDGANWKQFLEREASDV